MPCGSAIDAPVQCDAPHRGAGTRRAAAISPSDGIAPQLSVEQVAADSGIAVVAVSGELDVATVERFDAAMDEALDAAPTTLVVDMTAVTFLDSSGLASLLRALRRIGFADGHLVLACANPTVLRLFEITRTDATFQICATRDEALALARLDGS